MAQQTRRKSTRKRKSQVYANARDWLRVQLRFIAKRGGLYALLACLWLGIAGFCFLAYCALTLPDLKAVEALRRRPMILVLDRNDQPIAEYGDRAASPVPLSAMPVYLPNAVIATEDRRFYSHYGVDPFGLLRALFTNIAHGHTVQGGSTLTQQLAKNLFLTPERNLKRKVQEALLALWLERTYTKQQIIEAYLNRVYFGAGAYGVEAAAQTYFGKPVGQINLREAALLAGLLKAPSRYSPRNSPEEANARTNVVLAVMKDAELLSTADEKKLAKTPPLAKQRVTTGGQGRYFADWVMQQAQDIVGDMQSDLVIRTTLDRNLQIKAEAATAQILDKDGVASRAGQAAAVLIDNEEAEQGAVRVLIGGRDYQDSQYDRAIMALRQPGSSFKPFVYLAGLEAGLQPSTVMTDAPRSYGKYTPGNYDGKYHGEVTLREALAQSYNTIAVQVLDYAGVDRTRRIAKKLGITSEQPRDLSMALGSGAVTPYELVGAYAALANGGRAVAPYAIREIRVAGLGLGMVGAGLNGEVLYSHTAVTLPQVVDADQVATLTGMMMGVVTHGTGTAAALGDRQVAGKTGTSSDYRDAWFAGFTAAHTLAVWVGNDDNSQMKKVTGGGIPARLWHEVMVAAETGIAPQPLTVKYDETPAAESETAAPTVDTEAPAEGAIVDNSIPVPQTRSKPAANDNEDSGNGILGGVFDRLIGSDVPTPVVEHAYPKSKNN